MKHKIIDLIKNNTAKFSHYRKGKLYYYINIENCTYNFPVPIEDTDDATFAVEDKASMFLRWIRKADETDQLVMTEKNSVDIGDYDNTLKSENSNHLSDSATIIS